MANNAVKVVEVCKVAPQPSSPEVSFAKPPPHSLPLTLFDLEWLRFAPVQRLFFYEIPDPTDANFFHSTLIPKLKTSLSAALQQFLPLAGNVTWSKDSPKPVLAYVQGDGVSLTIAESDVDAEQFNHISRSDFVEAKEYHPFIPHLAVFHDKAAAMALQITIFPNRGFTIGTSMHHAILDGKTSTMFVKSWAHICNHESILLPSQLKPYFDRSVIKDPAGLESIYANHYLNMDRPNNRTLLFGDFKPRVPGTVRGTFAFTPKKIQALRQSVKKIQQDHIIPKSLIHVSTFCLTSAYTWVCLVKAKQPQADKAILVFTVDCRSRLDPPIPTNYVGNCTVVRRAVAETKGLLGEDGLAVAVNAITKAVKSLDEGVLKGAENMIPILYSVSVDERVLSIAGSPRFEIYETDFGWGRPKKVEIVSIEGTGAMSLSDSKDGGGGVDVGLALEKHLMDAFASVFAKGLGNF